MLPWRAWVFAHDREDFSTDFDIKLFAIMEAGACGVTLDALCDQW
jgi:hypothetical protein